MLLLKHQVLESWDCLGILSFVESKGKRSAFIVSETTLEPHESGPQKSDVSVTSISVHAKQPHEFETMD